LNEERGEKQRPRRKLGRGLSDVSHIFLSGARPPQQKTEAADPAEDLEIPTLEIEDLHREPSVWLPDAMYISITSGERVAGKSLLSANLAFSLRSRGYRVTLVNADPDQPDVLALTGCVEGGMLPDSLVTNEAFGELPVVTIYGGKGRPGESGLEIVEPLAAAGRDARLVISDTSPLADTSYSIWRLSSLVIVITEPDIDGMRSAYVTVKRVHSAAPGTRIGLIVNTVASRAEGEQCFRKISGVSRDFLKINLRNYGIIMRDQVAKRAGERRVPLLGAFPESKASECVESIARLILMDESAIARRRTEVRPEECALRRGA
jgi:flagellar biosynthesis protein FlhG